MGAAIGGKHNLSEDEINRKLKDREIGFLATAQRIGEHLIGKKSSTELYDIPLEVLDIIFKKSYLHWIFNSSMQQRDEEVIRSLVSVDVCFYQRIAIKRFKTTIRRYMKDFYERNKKHPAICRNNKDFLLKNIEPKDELIELLLSHNCITEAQSHFIQRQHSNQDKNAEILQVLGSYDERKCSTFVACLRQTNQTVVARIVENGGVVVKGKVKNSGTTSSESMELLHQRMSNLRNRTKPRSHQTDKFIRQMREEGIEILNSQLDRQTVVVWIWCRSQTALKHIQKLYESNELREVFFTNRQPSISKMINIDRSLFKKTAVVCPVSINFTHRIRMPVYEHVWGVTKLRNEIYVLCRSAPRRNGICVFEDRNQFRLQKKFKMKEMTYPVDIGSSAKENCLYVSDYEAKCVWSVIRETDDKCKIIKFLTTDYRPSTLSVSIDGHLLVFSWSSSILRIYGSDAELLRFIQLPSDMGILLHAMETSIGNFIIIRNWTEKKEEGNDGSCGGERVMKRGISELTSDGQMVIRSFTPSNETQRLNYPSYFSIDSDDRVFVADTGNHRVIILDSNLKWNRILCSTNEETEESKIRWPRRLCYDEDEKQLIVVDNHGDIMLFKL